MKTSYSFLFDAGSLFLVVWSAVVATLSIAAFGRDLLPAKVPSDPSRNSNPADPVRPTQFRPR